MSFIYNNQHRLYPESVVSLHCWQVFWLTRSRSPVSMVNETETGNLQPQK
jgi:hypothetical protein